jgi:hypothetical protein
MYSVNAGGIASDTPAPVIQPHRITSSLALTGILTPGLRLRQLRGELQQIEIHGR